MKENKKKNILITGITGFIGSHLAHYLAQEPNNVIYGMFRSMKDESAFKALKLDECKNINTILSNVNIISDIEDIVIQYDINEIYHLAAKVIVKEAAMEPIVTYITNDLGTLNILEVVRSVKIMYDIDIPTLIMSSDKAYGSHDTENLPYTEDLSLNGLDVYSSSKAIEDIMARAYAYNYNLPITVARPCNCYGEFDFHSSRLIPSLAEACFAPLNRSDTLTLNKGSYHYIREYIYVKDLVKALILMIENIDKTKGEAFNISSTYAHTTEQIVDMFLDLAGCKEDIMINFIEKESTFKEIEKQYLDGTKLSNVTDWKPEYDMSKGFGNTISAYEKWYIEQKEYYKFIQQIKDNISGKK